MLQIIAGSQVTFITDPFKEDFLYELWFMKRFVFHMADSLK
jgi:hypothetical protein